MRQTSASWLLGLAILAGFVPTVAAAPQKDSPPVEIRSLSGSILAARVAEADDDLDDAIAYYKRALSFDPGNNEIKQNLLLSLISDGRFDESLPYANELKTVPESERFSRLALAIDAMRKKDFAGAQSMMKLALQSDVDGLIAGLLTAWAKFGAGDGAGAATYLEKLEGPDWYGLFTAYHQGLIEEAAGLKDKADETFSLGLEDVAAASTAPGTYLRMAEAYAGFLARQGRKADALAVLDKADEFAPGRLPITALRAQINEGKPIVLLASTAAEGGSEVLFNIGSALDRDGGEPLVRLYLNYALALKPSNDLALMQLAEGAEQKEDAAKAISLYKRVPDSSPFKRIADMQLSLNLADMEKQDEAIALLKKMIAEQPDDMRPYLGLGSVYSSKDNFRAAADLLDTAAERLKTPSKEDWNVFYQRGIAYERLKEWAKAEPNFKKALELYPDQPQVMNYLGYSWVDMDRNLEEGLNLIRKAVDLRPSDGYIVDSLGWAYYKLGRYEEAVIELERAVSLKPEDPVLNDHLGDAYWRAGRQLEATFQWRHARDMKPEPDVLAQIEKKLKEGLPAIQPKAAQQNVKPIAVPQPVTPPAAPDKKTETPVQPAKPAAAVVIPVAPASAAPAAPADGAPAQDAQSAPAAAAVPATYIVKPGQSLWSIAVERLGNGERFREILKLNPHLRNPGQLTPGTRLTLPGT